jgi:hypothetical protein
MLTRRVMFQVDPGKLKLTRGKQFVLINFVVAAGLVKDHVKGRIFNCLDRNLMQVAAPGIPAALPAVGIAARWIYGDIKIAIGVCQVVEIAAVNVPGEDLEPFTARSFREHGLTHASAFRGTIYIGLSDTFMCERQSNGAA